MKRDRKEKTENNPQGDEPADPLSLILPDLKFEILAKVPAKSVTKLFVVSKFWSSIIRGKEFTNSYLTHSLNRPRLLCTVYRRRDIHHAASSSSFYSFSQADPSSHHIITPNPHRRYKFTSPVRGLICCQDLNNSVINNPSTGQFITLSKVKSRITGRISFLGYDPVNDCYKVLFMTVKHIFQKRESGVVSDEHQVFTIAAGQKWRMIKCDHPHRPPEGTKGLCMNGVVYYYAWTSSSEGSLMCFDMTSENFNVIRIPKDVRLKAGCEVVNYRGMIGLTIQQPPDGIVNGEFDLWVLEDLLTQEWLKISVSVPSWADLVENHRFWFRGAVRSSGELIFAPQSPIHPFFIVYYDLKENNARKVVIEGVEDDFDRIKVDFDHVESAMILPKVK